MTTPNYDDYSWGRKNILSAEKNMSAPESFDDGLRTVSPCPPTENVDIDRPFSSCKIKGKKLQDKKRSKGRRRRRRRRRRKDGQR